jgi:hypothetical protein
MICTMRFTVVLSAIWMGTRNGLLGDGSLRPEDTFLVISKAFL